MAGERTRIELKDIFSETMLQTVQDMGVVLASVVAKNENGEYQEMLFMGINPEEEFVDNGVFEFVDICLDWYWTHSHAIPMPEENVNDSLLQGLVEMSEKFNREDFKNEIKEHFIIKLFHGKDLDKCADEAERIMSDAIEAVQNVIEKGKNDIEIE